MREGIHSFARLVVEWWEPTAPCVRLPTGVKSVPVPSLFFPRFRHLFPWTYVHANRLETLGWCLKEVT